MEPIVQRRNMILQVVWMTLTFGLYAIYWFYVTSREMSKYLKREDPVMLWTILLFVPPLFFYSYYKQGELFEYVSKGEFNRWLTFAFWLLFAPAVWFLVQNKLNQIADQLPPPGLENKTA